MTRTANHPTMEAKWSQLGRSAPLRGLVGRTPDTEFPDPAAQSFGVEAQQFGCAPISIDSPVRLIQHLHDMRAFELA